MLKPFKFVLVTVVVGALLTACATFTPRGTIAEIVSSDPQFSTLAAALDAADLVDALDGEGPFTVFAPTNAAFAAALEAEGLEVEDLLAADFLADLLLYHVVEGELRAAAVVAAAPTTVPTLLEGAEIAVTVVDGGVRLNHRANVTVTNILASNGVIHVVDAVLDQPIVQDGDALLTIAERAEAAGFSILVAALVEAGFDELFADPTAGPFTVFAPTNAAFEALLGGAPVEDLLANPDLADILLYHVVPGIVTASDVVAAIEAGGGTATVPTLLEGGSLTIELDDDAVVINGDVTVINPDIFAWNGVIHVIDAVLLPPSAE
jgi:transforming growth factor-beta-induced protein